MVSMSLLSMACWILLHHAWHALAASMGLMDGSSKPVRNHGPVQGMSHRVRPMHHYSS